MTVVLVRSQLRDGLIPHASVILRNRGRTVSVISTVMPVPASPCIEPVVDEHLRAEMDEWDPVWLSIADVVVRAAPGGVPAPGCLVTAAVSQGRERVIAGREEYVVEVAAAGPPGMFASFVHTWMVSGRSITSLDGASVTMPNGVADRAGQSRGLIRARSALTSSVWGAPWAS